MIRVMFVEGGEPLVQTCVRVAGEDHTTDAEGTVELALEPGVHGVAVEREPLEWVSVSVSVGDSASLIVADVTPARPSTGMFATAQRIGMRSQSFGDRYEFVDVLGRGGMGVVVKATDTLLERTVAIKMLTEEFEENEEAQNIFLAEARAISGLAHPNLVSVYDVTVIDERAMIVFEFVEGTNIEDVFADSGALSEGELLRVGIQLGRALAYIHERGVIHRDLKPGNAIVQSDGTVRLIDFGLARSLEVLEAKGTRVRGTPAYMSPEQITGGELGPPADMYQLGVALFELASGRLPFVGGHMGYSHVHEDPPAMSEVAPDLAGVIAQTLDRCLEKEPSMRPTAVELVEVFEELYASDRAYYDAQVTALPPASAMGAGSAVTRTVTPTRVGEVEPRVPTVDVDEEVAPKRRSVVPIVLAALVLVCGVGAFAMSMGEEDSSPEVATAQRAVDAAESAEVEPSVTPPAPVEAKGAEAAPTEEPAVADVERVDEPDESIGAPGDAAVVTKRKVTAPRVKKAAPPKPKARDEGPVEDAPEGSESAAVEGDEGKVDEPEAGKAPGEAEVAAEAKPETKPDESPTEEAPKVPAEVASEAADATEPPVGASSKGASESSGSSDSERPKVRRVIRKKVIRKKKAAVPRSF